MALSERVGWVSVHYRTGIDNTIGQLRQFVRNMTPYEYRIHRRWVMSEEIQRLKDESVEATRLG